MRPVPASIKNSPNLPVNVHLVKSDISGLDCPWYFVRGEMVWSKKEGWKDYYEGKRDDCYFKSAEEAMKAWGDSEKPTSRTPISASSKPELSFDYCSRLRLSGSDERTMTNHEKELIAALEADIRRWDVLVLFFEQEVPEIEIHGLPKMTGREFASNLREKGDQYRKLFERIKNG